VSNFRTFFIVGLEEPYLNTRDQKLIEILRPAGIILYSRNFDYTKKWFFYLSQLLFEVRKRLAGNNLFVCIDHEGGSVFRLFEPFTRFPSAWVYRDFAEEVGKQMARELRQIGVNMNFAPCVDVLYNKSNQVIGERAFSDDPYEVQSAGLSFLRGLQKEGILGCFKHFPGHGSSSEDSHFELPLVSKNLEELLQEDLVPYHNLEDCKFIMTAHILYPKIDAQIATFSQRLLKSVLREQLSFKGLVISDDLEMKAVLDILLRRQIGLNELKLCGLDLAVVSQNTRALEEELVKVVLEDRSSVSIQEELCPAFSELTNLDPKIFDEGKKLLEKIENKF